MLKIFAVWIQLAAGAAYLSANPCLIQSKQVGPVRVGMTIGQARQVLRGATLQPLEDGDHVPFLAAMQAGARLMDLYPDIDERHVERAQIIVIRVYDVQCSTAEGIHPGALLAEVEKHYGKLLRLEQTETESREYAEFERLPNWMDLQAGNGEAGVYAKGRRCAYRYVPSAKVQSLWVAGPRKSNRFFENDSSCADPSSTKGPAGQDGEK